VDAHAGALSLLNLGTASLTISLRCTHARARGHGYIHLLAAAGGGTALVLWAAPPIQLGPETPLIWSDQIVSFFLSLSLSLCVAAAISDQNSIVIQEARPYHVTIALELS